MRGTLGSLYRRRNLGVRGSEKAGDLLGERLIGSEAGKLIALVTQTQLVIVPKGV